MGDRTGSSMLNWYSRIKGLPIPQPRTETVLLSKKNILEFWKEKVPEDVLKKVLKIIADDFKYPVFIRTDQSSAKHYWRDACYVESEGKLKDNIWGVVEFNMCADFAGLPFQAIVVREYIPMASVFEAFNGMPVNPERRYFVKGGEVLCHHHYWIEEAINGKNSPNLPENWKDLLKEVNTETPEEIELLTGYAEMVSEAVPGHWSVDFCKAKDGTWFLIDMALAAESWHPECPNNTI